MAAHARTSSKQKWCFPSLSHLAKPSLAQLGPQQSSVAFHTLASELCGSDGTQQCSVAFHTLAVAPRRVTWGASGPPWHFAPLCSRTVWQRDETQQYSVAFLAAVQPRSVGHEAVLVRPPPPPHYPECFLRRDDLHVRTALRPCIWSGIPAMTRGLCMGRRRRERFPT